MHDHNKVVTKTFAFEPRGCLAQVNYTEAVNAFEANKESEIINGFVGKESSALKDVACVLKDCSLNQETGGINFTIDILSETPNGAILLQLIEMDAKMRLTADVALNDAGDKALSFSSIYFVPA